MKKYIFLPLLLAFCFACGMIIAHIGMQTSSAPAVLEKDTKLETILNLIETEYVDKVNRKTIIENVIPHFLENLDPHTEYIPSQDYANLKEPIQGEFEGIGVQFNIVQDTVIIIQVIAGGPSELVGLQAGDRIIAVEDSVIAGKKINTDDVVRLLKGPKGTEVTVSIHRQSQDTLIDFTITRNTIPLYSIDASYMVRDSIGYIKISRFAMTTAEEFMNHMAKLSTKGMTSIIIDLRENGGGVLDAALFLANEFLNKDDLILFTQGEHYPRENHFADGSGSYQDLKLAVLINEYSASASEIVAGAIQDNDRGIVVGRRSFGKGLVNRDFMFSDSSVLRLTVQKFYTPSGRSIQKPYSEGNESYYHELVERYTHSELINKDSINFPDSLRYTTTNGRTVYGGGGIMPDVFVPLDTTDYSPLFTRLVQHNILYNFGIQYADKNRAKLRAINQDSIVSYLYNSSLLELIQKEAKKKNIHYTDTELQEAKKDILHTSISYIVRTIYDDEMFYRVYQKDDSTIAAAIKNLR